MKAISSEYECSMHKHIIELKVIVTSFIRLTIILSIPLKPTTYGDNRFFMTKIILLVAILSLGTFQDIAEHDATLQYF
jgi:hypothetical protein